MNLKVTRGNFIIVIKTFWGKIIINPTQINTFGFKKIKVNKINVKHILQSTNIIILRLNQINLFFSHIKESKMI